jgi:mannose-6-phosphate isomerase
MAEYPALADFVEFDTLAEQPKKKQPLLAFQSLLSNAMIHPEVMVQVIEQAALHLQKKTELNYREKLFMEMYGKYPGDMGLLAIFFLKLHSLRKGEALFIPAGVPHAYLKGNIVECMASSDNVIRGGLTPKFKDIPALLNITTDQPPLFYTPDGADYTYPTPVNEFSIRKLSLKRGQKILQKIDTVAILLVLNGKLKLTWPNDTIEAMHGQSILLPASLQQLEIECLEDAEIYKAEVP